MEKKKNKITDYFPPQASSEQQQQQPQQQPQQLQAEQHHQPQPSPSSSQSSPQTAPRPLPHQEESCPDTRGAETSEPLPSGSNSHSKSVKKRPQPKTTSNTKTNQRKKLPKTAKDSDSETEAAHGLKRSLHGIMYQLQLLILFAYRGLERVKNGMYADFFLGTEIEKAEKFDDVVFGYQLKGDKVEVKEEINDSNGEGEGEGEVSREKGARGPTRWIYLQAKHKQNPDNVITEKNLLTGKDENDKSFKLEKYLSSFCKMTEHIKKGDEGQPDQKVDNNKVKLENPFSEMPFHSTDNKPDKCHIKKEQEDENDLVKHNDDEENGEKENGGGEEAQPSILPGPSSHSTRPEKKESNPKQFTLCTNTYFSNAVEDWLEKNMLSEEDLLFFTDLKKFKTEEVQFKIKVVRPKILKHLAQKALETKFPHPIYDIFEKIYECIDLKDSIEKAKEPIKKLKQMPRKDAIPKNVGAILQTLQRFSSLKEEKLDEGLKQLKNGSEELQQDKQKNEIIKLKIKIKKDAETLERNLVEILERKEEELEKLLDESQIKAQIRELEKNENELKDILTDTEVVSKIIENEIVKKWIPTEELKKLMVDGKLEECKRKLSTASQDAFSKISNLQNYLKSINGCKKFLQNFRYIVKYPNVDELNELIVNSLTDVSKESKENLKLLKADYVDLAANTFEKKILDWLKEQKSTFLNEKDVNGLIESILKQVKELMVSGLSAAYPDKLKSYNIKFTKDSAKNLWTELEQFLLSKDKKIFHIETQATRLSAIKLYQYLEEKCPDLNYIFLRLRTLFLTNIQEFIVNAFSGDGYSLLVIDCQKNERYSDDVMEEQSKGNREKLWEKLWTKENCKSKQIIIIAEKECIFVQEINKKLEENLVSHTIDKSAFSDLEDTSQTHILQKRIDFQSFKTKKDECGTESPLTLKDILKKETGKTVMMDIVEEDILSELIEMEEIKIGNKKTFTSLPEYYIQRTLKKDEGEDEEVMNQGEGGLGYKEEDLSSLNPDQKIIRIIADDSGMGKSTYSASMIKKIKEKNPHLWAFKINLNDHAEENTIKSLNIVQNKDKQEENGAISFLLRSVVPGSDKIPMNKFQQKLFEKGLKTGFPKMVIFLDAFDETSPQYTVETTTLINFLKDKSKVTQIWITTRRHKISDPQLLKLDIFSLEPLTEQEQTLFLEQYWKWKLKFSKITHFRSVRSKIINYKNELKNLLNEDGDFRIVRQNIEETLESFLNSDIAILREKLENIREIQKIGNSFEDAAKKVLEDWKSCQNKSRIQDFPICPLFLKIVGTVIFDNYFQAIEEFGLLELYEKYEEKKFEIFFKEKAKTKPGNQPANFLYAISSGALKRVFQELAVKSLFPEEKQLPNLNEMEKLEKDLLSKNITGMKEELARIGFTTIDLKFDHRSFEEYFLSQYIITNCVYNTKVQLFSTEIVNLEDYKLIKIFLSSFLRKKPSGNDPHKREKQTIKMILEGSDNIQDTAHRTLKPRSKSL